MFTEYLAHWHNPDLISPQANKSFKGGIQVKIGHCFNCPYEPSSVRLTNADTLDRMKTHQSPGHWGHGGTHLSMSRVEEPPLRNEGEGLFIVITDAAWLIWYTAGKLADCVIFADDH